MERLIAATKDYAWGSREALAGLTGRTGPTDRPEAELWMGAHEAGPSTLPGHEGRGLDALVAADPDGWLGPQVAARFDGRLPYLLKVLAPLQALSIQAHPDPQQARDAPEGTYVDGWPKPEALLAVTRFEVFAGTRDWDDLRTLTGRLDVPALQARVEQAGREPAGGEPARSAGQSPVARLLSDLLRMPPPDQAALAREVVAAARSRGADDPDAAALEALVRVSGQHPDDIGLVVLLALRHRVVPPGGYLYLAAGVLHAYVHGVAVELQASSDNVVRAGLTSKRVDVEELLRIMDVTTPVTSPAGELRDGWRVYPADSPHFRLHTRTGDGPARLPADGRPRILLTLHGPALLRRGDEELRLGPGEACFVRPDEHHVEVVGPGTCYLAAPGV